MKQSLRDSNAINTAGTQPTHQKRKKVFFPWFFLDLDKPKD